MTLVFNKFSSDSFVNDSMTVIA